MRTDAEDLDWVVANADHFVSVAFRGCGKYDRVESPTLETAREAAKQLYSKGRPAMIFAVAVGDLEGATMRQRHVENYPATTR